MFFLKRSIFVNSKSEHSHLNHGATGTVARTQYAPQKQLSLPVHWTTRNGSSPLNFNENQLSIFFQDSNDNRKSELRFFKAMLEQSQLNFQTKF